MKQRIILTENDIHKIVNETINKILKEEFISSRLFSVYRKGEGLLFGHKPIELVKDNLTWQEAHDIVYNNKNNAKYRYWMAPNNKYCL